jgi:hypothetical protein
MLVLPGGFQERTLNFAGMVDPRELAAMVVATAGSGRISIALHGHCS